MTKTSNQKKEHSALVFECHAPAAQSVWLTRKFNTNWR